MHANQAKSLDFYQARFLSFDAHQTVSNIQPKPTSRFLYRVRTANIQMVRGLLVLYDGRKSGWANQHGGLLIIEISTWQMLQLSFASTF